MTQFTELSPINQILVDPQDILSIKRHDLVPLLQDPYRLNHYADRVIQAQSALLNGIDPHLTQQLSQTIEHVIVALADSKKILNPKRFNALQKWLGLDIEYDAGQVKYYKDLDRLLDQANHLSRKLQIEIQKSQSRLQQLSGLRKHMAGHIVAAQEFLQEYPNFVQNVHPLDNFAERLSKKINTLQTLQASNDIAMTQMQLSQQLSFSLLDRFKEAQQVLIPAWQYHVQQTQQSNAKVDLTALDESRDKLINTLRKSLEK